jgi:hypothetical protein
VERSSIGQVYALSIGVCCNGCQRFELFHPIQVAPILRSSEGGNEKITSDDPFRSVIGGDSSNRAASVRSRPQVCAS